MQSAILALVLVIPFFLGLPWQQLIPQNRILTKAVFCYCAGFAVALAVFELVGLPFIYTKGSFSLMCMVYSVAILALSTISLVVAYRKKAWPFSKSAINKSEWGINIFTIIYLIVFAAFVGYQLYMTITSIHTDLTFDDSVYVVYSTDALQTDSMYLIEPYTGKSEGFITERVLQVFLLLFGFVAKVTGFSVTSIAHTFLASAFLIIAYGVYFVISEDLFEEINNRLICLILIAAFYQFGYYSHYSLSFRFLGPIWQGKAVLAVILTPFLLTLMRRFISEEYHAGNGILLFLLSVACSSVTLIGAVVECAAVAAIVLISLFFNRQKKMLIYILWGGIAPVVFAGIYLIDRFV